MDDAVAVAADPTYPGRGFRGRDNRSLRQSGNPDIGCHTLSVQGAVAARMRPKARRYHRTVPRLCRYMRQDCPQSRRKTAGANADGLHRVSNTRLVFGKLGSLSSIVLTDSCRC